MVDSNGKVVEASAPHVDQVPHDADALQLILKHDIQLFCDMLGNPRIRLPDDTAARSWSLHHRRVRVWMANLIWDKSRFLLHEREIDRILIVLEGQAWHVTPRAVSEQRLLATFEDEPVLAIVVDFVVDERMWSGLMTRLLSDLNIRAAKRGVCTTQKRWPKSAQVLSMKLKPMKPILDQLGIDYSIKHSRDGAKVKLSYTAPPMACDVQQDHASPTASGHEASAPQHLRGRDDDCSESPTCDLIRDTFPHLFVQK